MSVQTADNGDRPGWFYYESTTTPTATVTYINGERQAHRDSVACAFADRELERLDAENARLRMVVKRLRERLAGS